MNITIEQKNSLYKYLTGLQNMVKYEQCELKDIHRLKNEIYHIDYYLNTAKVIKKSSVLTSEFDCEIKDRKISLLSEKARKLKSKYTLTMLDNYFKLTPHKFGQVFRYRNTLYLHGLNAHKIEDGNYNIDILDNLKTYKFTKVYNK